jgi:LysR family transcriptional activator of nhaA
MKQLNYHHLYYFYIIAREGSMSKAAKLLNVTPQTVSGQIHAFEKQLGYCVFDRISKRLYLNQQGKLIYQYASDMFLKGEQLIEILNTDVDQLSHSFVIGITDAIPKALAYNFIKQTMSVYSNVRFVFREGPFESLIADLKFNQIDLILADRGVAPEIQVNANSYFLGESHLSFFVKSHDAVSYKGDFPQSLHGQNILLPGTKSGIILGLTSWLDSQNIEPKIVAEFDDSALLTLFGSEGFGVFAAPAAITEHIKAQHDVVCLGEADNITERYYAITSKNRAHHDIVKHVVEFARTVLA